MWNQFNFVSGEKYGWVVSFLCFAYGWRVVYENLRVGLQLYLILFLTPISCPMTFAVRELWELMQLQGVRVFSFENVLKRRELSRQAILLGLAPILLQGRSMHVGPHSHLSPSYMCTHGHRITSDICCWYISLDFYLQGNNDIKIREMK